MAKEFSRVVNGKDTYPLLYVGPVPMRKQEAIVVEHGDRAEVVAYLRTPEQRDQFIACLEHIMQPKKVEDAQG